MRTLWRQRRVRAVAYVLVAASALAAVVAATPWHRPNDNGPLPVLSGAQSVSHIDPRLSEIASSFAGRRLQVRCWSAADWRARAAEVKRYTPAHIDVHSPWSGYQTLDHRRANFGPKVCGRLAALAYGRRGASSYDDAWWLAWSLGLFAHVTARSEKRAAGECHAMQRIGRTGEAFGLTRAEARRLARLFWRYVYPREDSKYRSNECRPDGKLDLDPANPNWP